MRFAIRDDDTNYYTQPEELESCYGQVWNDFPPTLSLISKVKGNWLHWVHQIYKDKQNTDWEAWKADDVIHPIEKNERLVSFLKEKIAAGKLDVSFHARHHRNGDPVPPEGRSNNYVLGAEYFTTRYLANEIKAEVTHLNNLLHAHITVFTPPQNLLSEAGYKSVLDAGLNLCGGGIPFYKKEKNLKGLYNMSRQFTFKLLHWDADYPRVLRYKNHNEIAYHYPLQPTTRLDALKYDFDMVRRYDGDFVLSTHYVEFDYPMVYDETLTMKQVLMDFLDYVSKYKVDKMSLSEMLK